MAEYPSCVLFPDTLDIDIVEQYLGRILTVEEHNLIDNFGSEREFNYKLEKLYTVSYKKKLYAPILTNLDGNCMFESLVYFGIGTSVEQLRKVISLLLYMYKDYKYLIPNGENTLKELFDLTNEISYVKCSNGKYYSYTYETMCQDVLNMRAWNKLPTELILMLISYVFKLEIVILNNVGSYENKINVCENMDKNIKIRTIHLGHIQEAHYFPLDYNNNENDYMYYDDHANMIKEWVTKEQQIKINEYEDMCNNAEYNDYSHFDDK